MKRVLRNRSQQIRRRTRLGVQRLEKRQLMAADIGLVDGFIAINGTEMDDVAEVYSDSGLVFVNVTTFAADGEEIGADSETFNESDVDGIVFQAGDGDDLFVNDTDIDSITRTGGGDDTVMGGGGNDILAVGMGNDVVLGGGGDDRILAGPGDDVVIAAAGPQSELDEEPLDEGTSDGDTDSELNDESNQVDESMEEDGTAEDPPNSEHEPSEESMIEDNAETTVAEPEITDAGDVAVEDAVDQGSSDENFVCHAHDGGVAGEDDPVVDFSSEPEVDDPLDPLMDSETDIGNPGSGDLGSGDLGSDDELVNDEAVDLSDDDDSELADVPMDPAVEPETTHETDDDVIFGGSGDDVIFGEAGSDLIFGGSSAVDDALLRMVIAGRLSLS